MASGTVEKIIMQSILKSVMDYNNSIEMLEPGVKKYFEDHYNEDWCCFYGWRLVDNGNNIKIGYIEYEINGDSVCKNDIIPTETIVSIAVELSFNKKYETLDNKN